MTDRAALQCPRCGSASFQSPAGDDPRLDDPLICRGCGRKTSQRNLIALLGKQLYDQVESQSGGRRAPKRKS